MFLVVQLSSFETYRKVSFSQTATNVKKETPIFAPKKKFKASMVIQVSVGLFPTSCTPGLVWIRPGNKTHFCSPSSLLDSDHWRFPKKSGEEKWVNQILVKIRRKTLAKMWIKFSNLSQNSNTSSSFHLFYRALVLESCCPTGRGTACSPVSSVD